jgi:hypothetical protein
MELAVKENTRKANKLFKVKSTCITFPEKKIGVKTKRFFTHCSILKSLRNLLIKNII